MDAHTALDLTDHLIFAETGKHLNDLEREVFLGSWQDKTYEEIYPLNPQYVEKDVGYKLWKKLSIVLGEKVTKKNFRGALERFYLTKAVPATQDGENLSGRDRESFLDRSVNKRILISYSNPEPDQSLATQLCQAIVSQGYQAFQSSMGSSMRDRIQRDHEWLTHLDVQLKQCDYFILLLSPQAALSEMVIEQLRRTKELQDTSTAQKPIILAIRVQCPLNIPLNHDLREYLQNIQQFEWNHAPDTIHLITNILNFINGKTQQTLPLQAPENHSTFVQTLSDPPVPVAEPELPSGQVRLASAFYVERVPYEALCYKEILQPGALIRIKAPRQMGKTSLMARVLYHAKEQGYRTVPLSFQHADTDVFTDLQQLLRWFCARIARKLRLPHQLDDYWTDTYGSKDNCTIYFEDCLLSDSDAPLVLGLDEVDRVFQYAKIADDFFGLLRAWYEEAGYGDGNSELWEKLRLVVVHSTEVYVPLNVNQSPFNVGLPIELPEFTQAQVKDLTQRHGLNWNADQIDQLMTMVGGHPYLVRLALYQIAQKQITLAELLETAPTEAGLYDDHLRRHWWNLQQHPELAAAFAKVVTANTPVELDSMLAFKLHSMGLVQLQENCVTPRFNLYRQYFRDRVAGN